MTSCLRPRFKKRRFSRNVGDHGLLGNEKNQKVNMIEEILYGGTASEPRTIVSVQSVSLGGLTAKYLQGLNYFEERNFYLLDLLRNKKCSCVVVLSDDIDKDFYEHAIREGTRACGLNSDDVAQRWRTLFVSSDGRSSLSEALLRNPNALHSLHEIIRNCQNPVLDFWAVSENEIKLAKALGIPHFGLTEGLLSIDSKSNGRAVFESLGIRLPRGFQDIYCIEGVREALFELASKTDAKSFLIKLNCEEAGNGIAKVARTEILSPIVRFVASLEVSKRIPVEAFISQIGKRGAVVEEYIEAPITTFPSVKMSISPDGEVVNLGTHDQVLNGMAYAGSRFPANGEYRRELIEQGYKIGARLAAEGVRGIVSADFMATRESEADSWLLWGLEINARKGATTHPYFWTRFLADASYDESTGELNTVAGPIRYRSSEYIQAEGLSHISASELIEAVRSAGLAYDPLNRRGAFIHMATCLRNFSKFGATFIGNSDSEIDELYARAVRLTELLVQQTASDPETTFTS